MSPSVRALSTSATASGVARSTLRGPTHYPIIGALPFFTGNGGPTRLASVFKNLYSYGNVAEMTVFGRKLVSVFDPSEFMKVHRAAGPTPTGGTGDLWMFHKYFSDPAVHAKWGAMPMAFSDDEKWRRPRHALQREIFGQDAAASYLPRINAVVDAALPEIPAWTSSGDELRAFTCRLTFEMIGAVTLGTHFGVLPKEGAHERDVQFVEATLAAQEAGAALLYGPFQEHAATLSHPEWRRFASSMDFILERAAEHVKAHATPEARAAAAADASAQGTPYLYRLLDADELTTEEVVLNVAGLLQGGVDTTANTLGWLLTHLAAHPEAQEAVAAEARTVLGDGPYAAEALTDMPMLRACIREAHRLTPTVGGLVRTLPEPIQLVDTRPGGDPSAPAEKVTVPAGYRINFSSIGFSHDPALVEAPTEFRPERWLGSKAERKGTPLDAVDHLLLNTPFSFGPRMCLGARVAQLELQAAIAGITRAYRMEIDPPGQRWEDENDFLSRPTPFPRIRFVPRGAN